MLNIYKQNLFYSLQIKYKYYYNNNSFFLNFSF